MHGVHFFNLGTIKGDRNTVKIFFLVFARRSRACFLLTHKAAYLRGEDTSMEWWEWVLDGFFYFDIIVNFFTGFDKGYEVVMDRKLIAMAYIKGWFIIDLISTIEWDQLIILFMCDDEFNCQLISCV
eukprot:SAG31_NODE_826_length_11751_cov_4.887659_2_plen_127_part_00